MLLTNLTSWLAPAFLVVGLLALVSGAAAVRKDRRRRTTWANVPGRVVGSRLSGENGQLQCRVAYQREGREFLFWNPVTSTTMTDPVGREVEVLVNPDNPDEAVVSRGLLTGGAAGYGFLAFGLLAVVVGAVLLR